MDEKIAVEALRQVKEAFDKYGIEYWLDMGTLLGAVRDGRIIPWDHDIDLGAWQNDIDKVINLCKNFKSRGFGLFLSEGNISLFKKNCKVDIYFYRLDNDKATVSWWVNNKKIGQILDYLLKIFLLDDPTVKKSRMPVFITKFLARCYNLLPQLFKKKIVYLLQHIYKKNGFLFKISVPKHFFQNLSTIKFYGMEFKVPAQTEKYLAYKLMY